MNRTESRIRVIIIRGNTTTSIQPSCRASAPQKPPVRRLVIIKNGEFIGNTPAG